MLEDILQAAGLTYCIISSTARSPTDQARVMYNNIIATSVAKQKKLYAAAGDAVIDEYVKAKAPKKSATEIKAAMEVKINEIGPTKVSHHASDPNVLCVFDVAYACAAAANGLLIPWWSTEVILPIHAGPPLDYFHKFPDGVVVAHRCSRRGAKQIGALEFTVSLAGDEAMQNFPKLYTDRDPPAS